MLFVLSLDDKARKLQLKNLKQGINAWFTIWQS